MLGTAQIYLQAFPQSSKRCMAARGIAYCSSHEEMHISENTEHRICKAVATLTILNKYLKEKKSNPLYLPSFSFRITRVPLSLRRLLEPPRDHAGFAYLSSLNWLGRELFFYKIPVHSSLWQMISFSDFKYLLGRTWLNGKVPYGTWLLQHSKFAPWSVFVELQPADPLGSMYRFSSGSQKVYIFRTAVWIILNVHKLKMVENC